LVFIISRARSVRAIAAVPVARTRRASERE
jgi:hypothetical protein